MNTNKQIVLLGGGYASIWAYRSLVRELGQEILDGEVSITVICPEDHHFFHGWTAESLTCIIQDKNRMSPLADLMPQAQLIKGIVTEINCDENLISFQTVKGTRDSIHYDHVLIAIGSSDSEQIEGIGKYGYQVKSHSAFLNTKKSIQSIVLRATAVSIPEAEKLLRFTICGGGFTGIELATNIAEFLNVLKTQYPSLKNVSSTIRLVTNKEGVLDTVDARFKKMKAYAENVLCRYGVLVYNNKRVVKVNSEGALLDINKLLPSSMVISAIGQTRICLPGTERMKRDNLRRICTNCFLQIEEHANVWGAGDACAVPYRETKKSCVANALWAIKQGECVGKNIARAIRQRPLQPFTFRGLGQCASLGIGKGMGELYGIELTGWIAWIARWFFFHYFMPSRKVMMNSVADWMYLLFFGLRRGFENDNQRSTPLQSLMQLPSIKNFELKHRRIASAY